MIPDHSISKGYPHDAPISQQRFANRLNIHVDSKGFIQVLKSDKYPLYRGISWLQNILFGKTTSFLKHRLYDYHEALKAAEDQIVEILFDRPFLPEDFGFEKLVGPQEIHDDPVTVYRSMYDHNITIHRAPEGNNYTLLKRDPDTKEFTEINLNLPCQRVAYNTFFALGVQVEPRVKDLALDGCYVQGIDQYEASLPA